MDSFDQLERALESGGPEAGFEMLAKKFLEEKKYAQLFETRLMKKRLELGLPLIQIGSIADLPADKRPAFEQAFIEAAREVGGLFLAEGDIPRAWSYFRAIGEPGPVAEAIEKVEPREGIEPVIEIAYHERVHPRKGFELILAQYGICRAITLFEQFPAREGRQECLHVLVRALHRELVENLKRAIVQNEGQVPETDFIPDLIAGRDWLFGEYSYYVDTSHLVSIIRFSLDLEDPDMMAKAIELTEYGKRLSPMFAFRGEPPFEDTYTDYGIYFRALLGQDVEAAIQHFREKAAHSDPDQVGTAPAQALVGLLARLDRYDEAIDIALQYLADADPNQLACPSVLQLCQLAGDYDRLRAISRQRGDLLNFAAGAIEKQAVA